MTLPTPGTLLPDGALVVMVRDDPHYDDAMLVEVYGSWKFLSWRPDTYSPDCHTVVAVKSSRLGGWDERVYIHRPGSGWVTFAYAPWTGEVEGVEAVVVSWEVPDAG